MKEREQEEKEKKEGSPNDEWHRVRREESRRHRCLRHQRRCCEGKRETRRGRGATRSLATATVMPHRARRIVSPDRAAKGRRPVLVGPSFVVCLYQSRLWPTSFGQEHTGTVLRQLRLALRARLMHLVEARGSGPIRGVFRARLSRIPERWRTPEGDDVDTTTGESRDYREMTVLQQCGLMADDG